MFKTKHLIILAICFASVICLFFFTRKWQLKNKFKAFLCIGVVSEIVKIFFYIIKNESEYGGVLPKSDLPFQLCSIQLIFALIVFFSKNEKLKRLIISFMIPSGLIGALAAILIPTYSALNSWVITFQYFIYHVVLITLALNLLCDKELKLTIKDYFACMVFVFCLMFFAIYINSMLYDGTSDINFMYVVNPPAENLPYLNEDNGWFIYFVHYSVLVVFGITICYIKQIITALKDKLSNKKSDGQPKNDDIKEIQS